MGCDISSEPEALNPKITPAKRNVSDPQKNKLIQYIEKDNLLMFASVMEEQRIFPNSEISDTGMQWMVSHMCCRWDAVHCLQYALKQYFSANPVGYIDFVNAPTVEGYTCLHICGIYQANRCFSVLMGYGGLNLRAKDKMNKTPLQTSLDFKATKPSSTLKQFKQLNIEFLQINTDKLSSGSILEDDPTIQEQGKKNESYDFKIDKNLYGVTGSLFDYSEEEKKMKQQKERIQLQKEKALEEKLKKREEKRQHKKEEKMRAQQKQEEQLNKIKEEQKLRKQEEQKKKSEEQSQSMVLGQGLLNDLIEDIQGPAEQEEQENCDSSDWGDDDWNDGWDQQDIDQIDKNMTQKIRKQELQIKKIEQKMKQIDEKKMTDFKESQRKQVATFQRKQISIQRVEEKNNYLKKHQGQINLQKSIVERPKAVEPQKRMAPQGSTDSIPPEIQKLYEEAKNSGKFVDREFPAQNSTIGDSSKSNYAKLTNNLAWYRPSQFLKGDYQLFNGIDPNDIKQGSLGVCYMLATISALASNPKSIEKLFIFHDISVGFFVVKLFINGIPKYMVLDDLIPCNKNMKTPLFTKPIGNQIWVLLLEKAWAKAIGNYIGAEAMTPDHMMQDLSGAPGYGSWFKNQGSMTREKKLEECMRHDSLGHIIVITSVGDKKIQGIANNHAYSMLKTFNHKGKKIFKIRNPWGYFEWNGQYGENSSLWTEQLKKIVNFQKKDDGIFYLSETQIFEAFCYYSVSQIHPQFKYSFYPFTSQDKEDLFFKFSLPSDTELNLRITQPFKRMIKDSAYDHSPMVFEVGKIEGNDVTFLSQGHSRTYWGAKSVHAFDDIAKDLTKGDYFVRVRMLWKNSAKYNSAVLGAYGKQSINIVKLSPQQGIPLFKKLLISFCKDSSERTSGKIKYKVVTMKGQFVFPVYGANETVTLKYDRSKMNMTDMGLGAINDHELQMKIVNGQPDVGTMIRTQPAKGGSTGQFYVTAS